ncbi:unnamed protein product [Phaedon cochleariae]|uniref:Cytochrome P450 n=1 Tax=Phaedon cochleariae TaxID=80249 RepID=A0A9N9X531_PHACE|nr:unnamed protein product [Phaedon cochleariae]
MLTEVLLALLALAALYRFCLKPWVYWANRGVKQRLQVPFFGENLPIILRLECFADMVQRIYRQFPNERYSGFFQFNTPILLIRDPELIKQITIKDFDHFVDHRAVVPENIDPIWGRNLFALTGQKWRDLRPVLSPSFTSKKLKDMFGLMSESAETFVDHFLKKKQDVIELELRDTFTKYAVDIIATTAYGIKTDSINDPKNEFFLMSKQTSIIFNGLRFFLMFFLPTCIVRFFNMTIVSTKLKNFFLTLVEDSIRIREEKNIVRPDMIHLLMEAQKGVLKYEEDKEIVDGFSTVKESDIGKQIRSKTELTNMDIASQAFIFFLGGFDTSASLMCFLGYELATHQEIQNKLREEVLATLSECNGSVTYDALLKMKYFDMVFSETLRKWTGGFVADRVCTKPYTIQPELPGEVPIHIKVGEVVWIPVIGIHKDPQYYPDPDRFDPERFSDENSRDIKPYTYLPFGSGPRNCIGSRFAILEAKTVFFHILSKFEIVPVGKSQIPVKLARNSVTLFSEGGFWFGLKALGSSV